MKLSQAIRKGAKLHPKGTDDYISIDEESYHYPERLTCALGAAFAAAHPHGVTMIRSGDIGELNDQIENWLEKNYEELDQIVTLPDKLTYYDDHQVKSEARLKTAIEILNDGLAWSREKIAAWVEALGL